MMNQAAVNAICESVAEGKSQREACKLQSVDESTFRLWRRESPEVATQYARACEERAEAWAEEFIGIADDGSNDWMEDNHEDNPGWIVNGEAIRRSQLRIDARKWMMARILPKKYGDKVQNEHSGPNGGAIPVSLEIDL